MIAPRLGAGRERWQRPKYPKGGGSTHASGRLYLKGSDRRGGESSEAAEEAGALSFCRSGKQSDTRKVFAASLFLTRQAWRLPLGLRDGHRTPETSRVCYHLVAKDTHARARTPGTCRSQKPPQVRAYPAEDTRQALLCEHFAPFNTRGVKHVARGHIWPLERAYQAPTPPLAPDMAWQALCRLPATAANTSAPVPTPSPSAILC
uniref:Uncharacterized protein n=1 Tax=Sphaerodactylus townsendi TaxID=933632 RepID=A0ACB8F334_9SAUR